VSLGFPLTNLGRVLLWQGDAVAAHAALARALAIREAALPAGHGLLADTLAWQGVALCQQGRFADARGALAGALAIRQAAPGTAATATLDLRAALEACPADPRSQQEPPAPPLTAAERSAWIAERGAGHRLVRWYLDRQPQQAAPH
jgi:tetratricopeptide (TPR) repeat protein